MSDKKYKAIDGEFVDFRSLLKFSAFLFGPLIFLLIFYQEKK